MPRRGIPPNAVNDLAWAYNTQITLIEVAGLIGKSVSAVERASAKLVKAGRIQRIGPKKGDRWEVLP